MLDPLFNFGDAPGPIANSRSTVVWSGIAAVGGFCGLAVGSSDQRQRWQRIAVSLAGPGAGFVLAVLGVAAVSLGACGRNGPPELPPGPIFSS